jgi:hypothetical protein
MSFAKTTVGTALFVFWCSAALGDILLEGAIYCDSATAVSEMADLARASDDKGLARLVATGHVAPKTLRDNRVKVLARGEGPDSPVQFAFTVSPITYWTLSRWVTPEPKEALSSPAPSPSSSPIPASPEPATKIPSREVIPPFDDQGGQIIWHQVNGKWKWRPRDPAHFKGVVAPRLLEN